MPKNFTEPSLNKYRQSRCQAGGNSRKPVRNVRPGPTKYSSRDSEYRLTCMETKKVEPARFNLTGSNNFKMAPRVGFEPTTLRLTAGCSAVELPRNNSALSLAQESIIRISFGCARPYFEKFFLALQQAASRRNPPAQEQRHSPIAESWRPIWTASFRVPRKYSAFRPLRARLPGHHGVTPANRPFCQSAESVCRGISPNRPGGTPPTQRPSRSAT